MKLDAGGITHTLRGIPFGFRLKPLVNAGVWIGALFRYTCARLLLVVPTTASTFPSPFTSPTARQLGLDAVDTCTLVVPRFP